MDCDTAHKIFTSMNLNTSSNRTSAAFDRNESPAKKTFGSFKSMKRDKKKSIIAHDIEMENAPNEEID